LILQSSFFISTMSDSLDDMLADASSLSLSSGGALGAPGVSASPFAFAPARVLGVGVQEEEVNDVGTTSSKRYSVVTVRGSDSSLCFGVVGVGGVSFCIRKNCRIKAHGDSKFWLAGRNESVIFISRVLDAVVYTDPFVKEGLVTLETQEHWKGKSMTLPSWVRSFRAVTISDTDEKVSIDDVKIKTKFLSDAEKFRTPAKKRRTQLDDEDREGAKKFLNEMTVNLLDRALPSVDDVDALDAVIIDGSMLKGGLTRIVARVEANVSTLGEALREISVLTHERFVDNEKDVKLMSGVIQNLHATLGHTVGLDPRFEAPTLWGTTSCVAEEVARIAQLLHEVESDISPMKASLAEVQASQDRLLSTDNSNPEALEKMRKVLMLVMGHVKNISPELNRIKRMIHQLEVELAEVRESKRQQNPSVRNSPMEGDSMDELMNLMTSGASVGMEYSPTRSKSDSLQNRHQLTTPIDDISRGGTARLREEIDEHKTTLCRMESEISMLVGDIGLLKACSDDESVKFGGLGLRTLQECHGWVGDNFKNLRYGLVLDPLLLLDRIFGSDDAEAESQFKVLESRVKLRISTGAEAAAIKALHFSRPRLFHHGRVAMVSERNTSKLSKLPTYKSWKSAGDGVSNYAIRQMNLIHSTVANDIGYAFGFDSQLTRAQVLATASLNASITFLTQLIGFIDTIYEKLLVQSRFTTDQAWALTTQILDRVCEDLYAPKEGVAAAMTVEDPASICAHVLWSCLKVHDVMTSYLDHHFVNHPAISAEYVKFLATNSGSEKVDKMESVIAGLTEKLSKSAEETKKAINKADVATSKCSDLVKEVQALAKKVKQLEDKAGR
jgi:hypothetical protein